MPKSLDKTKGAKKRKKTASNTTANTESDTSDSKSNPKKKKVQRKRNALEGIEMSKQLAEIKQKKSTRNHISSRKNTEPRVCGNGKPMPSLAELEAMYNDSDEDETSPIIKTENPPTIERCETPEQKPLIPEKANVDSPETLKRLASKVIDIISKTINLVEDDDGPPPPVIPQKRPKTNNPPHIVGCKERPQVPWAPKSKFGVSSEKYGIDPNQVPDDDSCDGKRKKRGKPLNISKSIFNAKSDEIAERLKELESAEPPRAESPDSSDTLDYDFPSIASPNNLKAFSPLPSTSKDRETILKNDELFNESLKVENSTNEHILTAPSSPCRNESPGDVEVIEVPCETINVDDVTDITKSTIKRSNSGFDDDCCIIVEPENKRKRVSKSPVRDCSPLKDDIYGSIDLTETFDNEVFVIDDDEIDNLMAENKAILEKDVKKNIDTVTFVDPNVITIEPETTQNETQHGKQTVNSNTSSTFKHPINSNENESSFGSVLRTAVDVVNIGNENSTVNHPPAHGSMRPDIAEVVNNFFTQPQTSNSTPRTSDGGETSITVDLTSSQELSMLNRISSWISSIESLFSGRQNTRTNNAVEVVHIDNYLPQRIQNAGVVNIHQQNQFAPNRISTEISPRKRRQNQNRKSNDNDPPQINAVPSLAQSEQNSVTSPSQPSPPRRSLGDCPICMDSLANTAVASTMCGHIFCMACIKAAIKSNGKKCPTCRKSLKGVGYHQIFL